MKPENCDLDVSKQDIETALLQIHDLLKSRSAPKPGSFSALDAEGRREYYRIARQRSRARHRASDHSGDIQPSLANVRNALADAALMILATDAPGAAQILTVLGKVFASKPGVPLTVQNRARSGKLRPKMIGVAK